MIEGANHGQFGTYDDSERETLLDQIDGVATISTEEQQEQATSAIAYVATGGRIVNDDGTAMPSSALIPSHHLYFATTPMAMAVALAVWWAI